MTHKCISTRVEASHSIGTGVDQAVNLQMFWQSHKIVPHHYNSPIVTGIFFIKIVHSGVFAVISQVFVYNICRL